MLSKRFSGFVELDLSLDHNKADGRDHRFNKG